MKSTVLAPAGANTEIGGFTDVDFIELLASTAQVEGSGGTYRLTLKQEVVIHLKPGSIGADILALLDSNPELAAAALRAEIEGLATEI